MSSESPSSRLLIVDPDIGLIDALHRHFEAEGYDVLTATTGQDGLGLAITARPQLVLLAATLPDVDSMAVFRALRDKPRTSHIPMMVLAGRGEAMLRNHILEEGAYDFIEKPVDLAILTLRVRNALRRAEREGLTEPRTGLPTGRLIDERLAALENELGWYQIDLKLAHFGVFRDRYGFVAANEALRFAGNLIAQIVNEHGSTDDFVGHTTGTEEFIVITTQTHGPALYAQLTRRIGQELGSFYSFIEREQGFVEVEDGTGGITNKPLMDVVANVTEGPPDPDAATSTNEWVDAIEPDDSSPDDQPGSLFEW
ncbi:MAG: response regulator [Anaerolineae bacterium]|nr:response regulator [Anaerolineae bacterium]